ncbi:galactosylceramide sulfotransferase [Patella vulgata]|uniref:galactosylceramide sulfotransferase n=1 Tax=Patella vulgata TaxID=6465 RepID=UPI0024A91AB3|nr:galactosylceramide sulfotransferase [Patella vulgata]
MVKSIASEKLSSRMSKRNSKACCNCFVKYCFNQVDSFQSPRKKPYKFIFLLIVTLVIIYVTQTSKTILNQPPLSELRRYSRSPSNHLTTPFPVNELRHVAFLKVHKACSSTVLNIIYRFGFQRGLTFVLPRKGNYLGGRSSSRPIEKHRILPPSLNKTYDMLCNHVIFNKTIFGHYLPRDTVYIAIVRDPYERFRSAYHYYRTVYRIGYLIHGPTGADHFEQFIANQDIYEPTNPYHSYTNNRMAVDFGFPTKYFKNSTKMLKYVQDLDLTFDLVMITERFDESMILLRRMLNWSFKDILYIKLNALKNKPKNNINSTMMDKVKKFSELDYILYNYFYEKFDKRVKQQPSNFSDEVSVFTSIREQVATFCLTTTSNETYLWVADTKWSEAFTISYMDCKQIKLGELKFLSILVKEQKSRISRVGVNRKFFDSISDIHFGKQFRYLPQHVKRKEQKREKRDA